MYLTGKRADHYRYLMMYSNKTNLFDAYAKPSYAKICNDAWCREKCQSQGGYNYTILSYNSFTFSVGWITEDAPNRYTLHVETHKNSYEMEF